MQYEPSFLEYDFTGFNSQVWYSGEIKYDIQVRSAQYFGIFFLLLIRLLQ